MDALPPAERQKIGSDARTGRTGVNPARIILPRWSWVLATVLCTAGTALIVAPPPALGPPGLLGAVLLASGAYLAGVLRAPERPSEAFLEAERARFARSEAGLNRVLVALALRGSAGGAGDGHGTPASPPEGESGGPDGAGEALGRPRLVRNDPRELDQQLPGEPDEALER